MGTFDSMGMKRFLFPGSYSSIHIQVFHIVSWNMVRVLWGFLTECIFFSNLRQIYIIQIAPWDWSIYLCHGPHEKTQVMELKR